MLPPTNSTYDAIHLIGMMGEGYGYDETFSEIEQQTIVTFVIFLFVIKLTLNYFIAKPQAPQAKVIGRLERHNWALKYFNHMGATQEQRDLHCGFVRCEDEAMKLGDDVPQAREGRTIRFTTTITISEFIVNSCTSSSNFFDLSLQQVTTPILKVPRYGGKVVGFDALDADDQDIRALMLAFQDEELDLSLAEEAITNALHIANTFCGPVDATISLVPLSKKLRQ
jgi:hypothetical protein